VGKRSGGWTRAINQHFRSVAAQSVRAATTPKVSAERPLRAATQVINATTTVRPISPGRGQSL